MKRVRLFYGSTTGNTKRVATLIQDAMGDVIESVTDIAEASPGDLSSAEALILGVSTWDDGQLQEDWESFLPLLEQVDLTGKTVALFGLGDASTYSDQFVDALGSLHEKVLQRGARVVGSWSADDYDFSSSTALVDGKFVGLVVDEDNESALTEARIKEWVRDIGPAMTGN